MSNLTMTINGESIEIEDLDYTADLEPRGDQIEADVTLHGTRLTGTFTMTWTVGEE